MPRKQTDVHIVPDPQGWAIRREGNTRASALRSRQADAVTIGRGLAQRAKVELLIHGEDGTIQSRNSYGNDPFPPKG